MPDSNFIKVGLCEFELAELKAFFFFFSMMWIFQINNAIGLFSPTHKTHRYAYLISLDCDLSTLIWRASPCLMSHTQLPIKTQLWIALYGPSFEFFAINKKVLDQTNGYSFRKGCGGIFGFRFPKTLSRKGCEK